MNVKCWTILIFSVMLLYTVAAFWLCTAILRRRLRG